MTTYDELVNTVLAELESTLRSINTHDLQLLKAVIVQAPRVFVAGKGRSGLQMRGFAMRVMHMGLTVHVIDDVTTPAIAPADLLLIGSSSGRTASLVEYAKRAKSLGAGLGLITSATSSPIAERADVIVRLNAPSPKVKDANAKRSIQPMGNLFEQALGVLLDILTLELMEALNLDSDQMFRRHANLE
jgi:6-phospho-3-hexuloisomerase